MYRSFLLGVVVMTLAASITLADPWVARHGLTGAQYQAEFDRLTGQGYRLQHVSGYGVGNQVLYAAIWDKRPGPDYVARHGLTGAQYQAEFDRLTGQGYRLTLVDGYGAGNQALYAAIWERRSGPPQVARHGLTGAQYQAEFDRLTGQGYRLQQVSGYGVGNQVLYAAIWEKKPGPDYVARHGLTGAQYQAEFDRLTGQGYRLTWVDGYGAGNQALYAAIWERRSGPPQVARHGLTGAQYQAEFDRLNGQGYRLRLVEGYGVGNQAYYAAIWDNELL
jgi:hypothetical protein